MSWTTADMERWLRNAGKDKTIFFSYAEADDKFFAEVEDPNGYVEGRSSTLPGAIDSVMTSLQQRAYKESKVDPPPVPAAPAPVAMGTTNYPTCPVCSALPTLIYCDGRATCRCGVSNWTVQLSRGFRAKLTNGHVYEYDGALWDIAIP